MFLKKTIEIKTYRCYVNIVISDDIEKVNTLIPESVKRDSLFGDSISYFDNGNRFYCIVLNTNHSEFDISIIAHEINHTANFILEHIGHIADYKNDECESYLKEWLFKEVVDFLIKKNILEIKINRDGDNKGKEVC